jgi:DNA-binding transcriptional regulator YiaG
MVTKRNPAKSSSSRRNVGAQLDKGMAAGGPELSKASIAASRLEIGSVRRAFGLSRRIFSRLSGYSERAIADWESGKPYGDATRQRMVELLRLQKALARVMKDDIMGQWLQTPNDAFNGLKPLEVIERGEVDRIWQMIYLLESGVPG